MTLCGSGAALERAAVVDFNQISTKFVPKINFKNCFSVLFKPPTPNSLPKVLAFHVGSYTKLPSKLLSSQSLLSPNLLLRRSSPLTAKPLLFQHGSRTASRIEAKIEDEAKCDDSREGASGAAVRQDKNPGGERSRRLKIVLYFVVWWALNVVFNIYNKKTLDVFPFPWLTSWLCLAAGAVMMLSLWATGLVQPPRTDPLFWKGLFPVALAHTIGHVAVTFSMSRAAMAFTHVIKSAEPAFSVIIERLFMGVRFPWLIYLSLVPIITGCFLSGITELEFDQIGFLGAMVSNISFVFRNLLSKKVMKRTGLGGINFYACLCLESLILLTPMAVAAEGPQVWASAWQNAIQRIGPQFVWWVMAQSMFYHLYNQVSYMSLSEISPLTFSIGNAMKRLSLIIAAIMVFKMPVKPMNLVGAGITILGALSYHQLSSKYNQE